MIAEDLHPSKPRIYDIETAALLHDIGKIEALYADVISKPYSLSDTERALIRTDATKGAGRCTASAPLAQKSSRRSVIITSDLTDRVTPTAFGRRDTACRKNYHVMRFHRRDAVGSPLPIRC